MLGATVAEWLSQNGFAVMTTATRYNVSDGEDLIREAAATSCSAVVNCIGTTLQRAGNVGNLFAINALLPQRLAVALGAERLLIQASSDAVFDGRRGQYTVREPPNSTDPYGLSKRLCEMAVHLGTVVVLRCSIVGLDRLNSRGLLSWFLARQSSAVGYTDHLWNGITTLQWARIAQRALEGDSALEHGIHQPGSPFAVTKHELLELAGKIFGHHLSIVAASSGSRIDRTLIPSLDCPGLAEQFEELRDWEKRHR